MDIFAIDTVKKGILGLTLDFFFKKMQYTKLLKYIVFIDWNAH